MEFDFFFFLLIFCLIFFVADQRLSDEFLCKTWIASWHSLQTGTKSTEMFSAPNLL